MWRSGILLRELEKASKCTSAVFGRNWDLHRLQIVLSMNESLFSQVRQQQFFLEKFNVCRVQTSVIAPSLTLCDAVMKSILLSYV
jgi:hypothetical protein